MATGIAISNLGYLHIHASGAMSGPTSTTWERWCGDTVLAGDSGTWRPLHKDAREKLWAALKRVRQDGAKLNLLGQSEFATAVKSILEDTCCENLRIGAHSLRRRTDVGFNEWYQNLEEVQQRARWRSAIPKGGSRQGQRRPRGAPPRHLHGDGFKRSLFSLLSSSRFQCFCSFQGNVREPHVKN